MARRTSVVPAMLAATVGSILVAVAVWKPWATTAPQPPDSALVQQLPSASIAAPALPAATRLPSPPVATRLDGLNLWFMGESDPHRAWGVAVAYIPRRILAEAARSGSPAVTPVVDWETEPAGSVDIAPTLDYPGVVTVALAVTWPAGPRPLAVRLVRLPEAPPRAAALRQPDAAGLGAGEPAGAEAVDLSEPIPLLVGLSSPAGRMHFSLTHVAWERVSGTFFLPSTTQPSHPADWLSGGWPAGRYAFEVEGADGALTILRFDLVGGEL